MNLASKKKIALVLSGGGVKAAAFHVGVCLALQQKGFKLTAPAGALEAENDRLRIKMFVGSSAGAIISAFLASGYDVEDMVDAFQMGQKITPLVQRKGHKPRLKPLKYWHMFHVNGKSMVTAVPSLLRRPKVSTGGFEALLKTLFKINGFFTTAGIEGYLRKNVLPTNDFRRLNTELYIVATQLNHSRKVVFGPFDETIKKSDIGYANYASISNAVAASASLPPAFAPYGIVNERGKMVYYFDGEIRDTLSTHVAADAGADLVIASYSVQPYHFNKTMGSLHEHGIPLILNQALYQVIEQKIKRHIHHQNLVGQLIQTVESYFSHNDLPAEHKDKLIETLSAQANYNRNVDYVYIHPHPQDYEMFFYDHFSLNPEILSRIVKIGFKSGIRVLRQHNL